MYFTLVIHFSWLNIWDILRQKLINVTCMDHNKVNIEFILALIIISVKFQDHVDISKSKSLSVINL